jgi:hypothetical protein
MMVPIPAKLSARADGISAVWQFFLAEKAPARDILYQF